MNSKLKLNPDKKTSCKDDVTTAKNHTDKVEIIKKDKKQH